jgi:hypothetical protein
MARVSFLLRHLANLCAPGLIVLLPFFGFVRFHDYPVWSPEVLLVVAAILALGTPFGLLLSVRAKTFGAAVITVLLLAWSCNALLSSFPDTLFLWDSVKARLTDLAGTVGMNIAILAASALIAAVLLFLAGRLDRNLGLVITTIFGVGIVSTFVLPSQSVFLGEFYRGQSIEKTDSPPIIHLVLDEHIGLQGLPGEIDRADELRDELRAFYEGFGFRVFGRAYSQYADTKLSLAAMLSGRPNQYIMTDQDAEASDRSLRQNPWFELLVERGYRLRVYHSYDVNFCGKEESEVQSCYGYSVNTIKSLQGSDLPVFTLAKAISASFLDTLIVYRMWLGSSPNVVRKGAILPNWLRQLQKYAAPASLPVLDQVLQDLEREPRGSAFFVHLLIPHHTYLYDKDCRIKQDIEIWANHVSPDANFALGLINTPDSRRRSYASYFEQLQCTRRALQAFFEDLQRIGAFDDGTIIVHGDHGSRIALVPANSRFAQLLSDADVVDLYSVLFAVRGPGFDSGYDNSFRSIQSLFAETLLNRTLAQEPGDVVLRFVDEVGHESQNGDWLRIPMPAFEDVNSVIPEHNEAPAPEN